jgi:ABC-2 type transport system permease protein
MWALLVLALALSVSVIAIGQTLATDLLDAREGAVMLVRLAPAVGGVLAMLFAADSISGERERATLESLMLTPTRPSHLVLGKALAALSIWLGCYLVSIPYLITIQSVAGASGDTVFVSGIAGGLAALLMVCIGLLVSIRTSSNRSSLLVSLLLVAVLAFPGLLPASAVSRGFAEWLVRVDPLSSLARFLSSVVVDQEPMKGELVWLISPISFLALAAVALGFSSRSVPLDPSMS